MTRLLLSLRNWWCSTSLVVDVPYGTSCETLMADAILRHLLDFRVLATTSLTVR